MYHLHLQDHKSSEQETCFQQGPTNNLHAGLYFGWVSTVKIDVILSSETPVLTRTTHRHTTEDGILHSHRRENLKSYIALAGWTL
jgi:hypothetical protein